MTYDPEDQAPRPEQSPEDRQSRRASVEAPTPSATAAPPAFPPGYPSGYPPAYPPAPWPTASGYGPPGVYPPPPEYYQQQVTQQATHPAPAYPPVYPPAYPPAYGQYPTSAYPPAYQQPYPPSQQYPGYTGYPGYPVYAPAPPQQPAAPARAASGGVGLFWPIVSALASFALYALLLGWQFGLGFMALLLVHEMGHFVVIRAKGLPAGLPIFIPLVGAFVTMRQSPANVRDEAEIALAGPVAGTFGGVVCLLAYWQTGLPVLLPLAYFSFYINLLNLIPVGPLDGARVTAAISKWIWPLGLIGVGIGAWYTHNVLLIALGALGAFQLIARFNEAGKTPYYAISPGARIAITLVYFGLAALLAYGSVTLQPLMAGRLF